MKRIKLLLFLAVVLNVSTEGYCQQNELAQFAFWKPKDRLQFENGYKKHLQWHRDNGDTWSWWGWFVIFGPRYGQFADATFHRTWRDLITRSNLRRTSRITECMCFRSPM